PVRYRDARLRSPLAGGRVGRPALDGPRLGRHRPSRAGETGTEDRGEARGRPADGRPGVAETTPGRDALRPGTALRSRASLWRPHGDAKRQLLEPRHALCPR